MRTLKSELLKLGFKSSVKTASKKNRRRKERFTNKELADLMGTNRATYKRVNGAVRRK